MKKTLTCCQKANVSPSPFLKINPYVSVWYMYMYLKFFTDIVDSVFKLYLICEEDGRDGLVSKSVAKYYLPH